MRIHKHISTQNSDCITISYTEDFFNAGDTSVVLYDKYKISILLTDGLNAVVNNKIINSSKHNILFFRPDEHHFGHFTCAGTHKYLDFFIPMKFFEYYFRTDESVNFFNDTSDTRINYISDSNSKQEISKIAQEAYEALCSDTPLSDIKLLSLTMQIILFCAESYTKQKESPRNTDLPLIVTKTLDYISQNYAQKISLDILSGLCNCSIAYLSRTFKNHIGTTIYKHIIATRIAQAQIMLKNGATVTEACFASGFEDCSNFIQTFKRITGKTPYVYKNEQNRFLT